MNSTASRWTITARIAVLACAGSLAISGCATTARPHRSTTTGNDVSKAHSGGKDAPTALITEINRELTAMRRTHYQHRTEVDETEGKYFYDCSGLVDYALKQAAPADLDALPVSTSTRPLAADIEQRLRTASTGTPGPWQTVPTVSQLRPGDLIAWLATEDSTTGDTGHVMIVLDTPQPNPQRPGEWLIHIADSTLSPHAQDTRTTPTTGLGAGTIGLTTDNNGHPTAFYWRGGLSPHPKPTDIALGRPT